MRLRARAREREDLASSQKIARAVRLGRILVTCVSFERKVNSMNVYLNEVKVDINDKNQITANGKTLLDIPGDMWLTAPLILSARCVRWLVCYAIAYNLDKVEVFGRLMYIDRLNGKVMVQ